MYKKIIIALISICVPVLAMGQATLQEVLESVERNNLTLQAQRHTAEAKSLEARTGNSLDDLSVSYDHLWGKPVTEFGKTAEFAVSQSFDFPTVYARRNKLAANLGEQYLNELSAVRQGILLEAKKTYFELLSARQLQLLLDYRLESNKRLSDLYKECYESGDASLLEKNKMHHEYLLFQEVASENRIKIVEYEKKLTALNGGEPVTVRFVEIPLEELRPYREVVEDYKDMYPALQALRLQEKGAEYDLKLSRSQSLPKFELGYKHEYATAGDRFNGVTVGLSIPIFSNRNNVKRANAFRQAAQVESRAAEVECATQLEELYGKAALLRSALAKYDGISEQGDYLGILSTALEEGEITVVEYFSEIYSYYDVFSAKLRLELEYRLTVAEINSIYL